MRISTALLALCFPALVACTMKEADPPTPLMSAAGTRDAARVRGLIAAGADVNETRGVHRVPGMRVEGDNPQYGETALMYAVDAMAVDAARVLLDAGARVDARDTWGRDVWSRLEYSAAGPDGAAMVRLLLERAGSAPQQSAAMILGQAVQRGNEELVELVIDRVKEPQLAYCQTTGDFGLDRFRSTMALLERRIGPPKGKALECALETDSAEKMAYFLSRGADPNREGAYFLPITLRAFNVAQTGTLSEKERDMIKVLLHYGADPRRKGRSGHGSAIDIARKSGNAELLTLLEREPPR